MGTKPLTKTSDSGGREESLAPRQLRPRACRETSGGACKVDGRQHRLACHNTSLARPRGKGRHSAIESPASPRPGPSSSSRGGLRSSSRHACPVCSKTFGSPGKLGQHMYVHTGERPFQCPHCPKAFSSKFKLVRHVLIHSDERKYRCTACERTFHRKDHLKNHVKVHSPVKKTFRCEKEGCSKEYCSQLSYRKHAAVHAAEEGSLECKMCGQQFESKEQIVYHLKVHAGSRTVKNPSDKKYRCEHCDRKFFTRKDVRRHLVVHTGKRDFLCQFCPQRFGRKDHLVRHIKKSHHGGNLVRKGKRVRVPVTSVRDAVVTPSPVSRKTPLAPKPSTSRSYVEPSGTGGPPADIVKTEVVKLEESIMYTEPPETGDPPVEAIKTEVVELEENILYTEPPPPYPSELQPSLDLNQLLSLMPSTSSGSLVSGLMVQQEYQRLLVVPEGQLLVEDPQFLQLMDIPEDSPQNEQAIPSLLSPRDDMATNTTPLPRFNQAFQQQPPQ